MKHTEKHLTSRKGLQNLSEQVVLVGLLINFLWTNLAFQCST